MAHLWFKQAGGTSHWMAGLLEASCCRLTADREGGVRVAPAKRPEGPSIWLIRDGENREEQWVLLAAGRSGAALRCNGMPVHTGIRVLRERDEVLLPGCGPVYFSMERIGRVTTYPSDEKTVICPRCRQPVSGPAVQCPNPNCGAWHHQSADLPCWTGYVDEGQPFEGCALCGHPATLYPEAEFTWTPEGL